MRLLETHLRQLVRSILLEAEELPPVDEPNVKPGEALGQWVMPLFGRLDASKEAWKLAAKKEPYTELEKQLASELQNHLDANMGNFEEIWEPLMGLVRAGLYKDILIPPAGTAYRLMSVDPDHAERILGVTKEELKAQVGVAQLAPNPPSWTGRNFVTSWTLDPMLLSERGFGAAKTGYASIMLVANVSPGDGHFMMNPAGFSERFSLGRQYASETEVLGGGTIPLVAASWIWWGELKDLWRLDKMTFAAYDDLQAALTALKGKLLEDPDRLWEIVKQFEAKLEEITGISASDIGAAGGTGPIFANSSVLNRAIAKLTPGDRADEEFIRSFITDTAEKLKTDSYTQAASEIERKRGVGKHTREVVRDLLDAVEGG